MTMLGDLPAGPQLRPERAQAEKTVLSAEVREAKTARPAHLFRAWEVGARLKGRPSVRLGFALSALSAAAVVLVVALIATPTLRTPGVTGAILYTTDGGASWNKATVPSGLSMLSSLSCTDTGNCLAVYSDVRHSSTAVLASTDGGETWAAASAIGSPPGLGTMSLSCPGSGVCWVSGDAGTPGMSAVNLGTTPGFVASTSNGGAAWQDAQLPQGIGAVLDVSCPAQGSCYALALRMVSANTPQPFVLLAYGVPASTGG